MTTAEGSARRHPAPRRKKWIGIAIGAALAAVMLAIVFNQWRLVAMDQSQPIGRFSAALQQHGLTAAAPLVVENVVKVPHDRAYEITVGDQPVWVVYFDLANPAQQAARAKIAQDGKLEVVDKELPARVRGAVALAGVEGHPQEKAVIAAFDEFQFSSAKP